MLSGNNVRKVISLILSFSGISIVLLGFGALPLISGKGMSPGVVFLCLSLSGLGLVFAVRDKFSRIQTQSRWNAELSRRTGIASTLQSRIEEEGAGLKIIFPPKPFALGAFLPALYMIVLMIFLYSSLVSLMGVLATPGRLNYLFSVVLFFLVLFIPLHYFIGVRRKPTILFLENDTIQIEARDGWLIRKTRVSRKDLAGLDAAGLQGITLRLRQGDFTVGAGLQEEEIQYIHGLIKRSLAV